MRELEILVNIPGVLCWALEFTCIFFGSLAWAAWEEKQAAYCIWKREAHAETMRRELGSDSDD